MPKLEYFLVCESVSIDQETNRVSLFNIIEDIQPATRGTSGVIIVQLVAASCWIRAPGDEDKDFQAILRIHASEEEPKDFAMNFRMEKPRQRLSLRIQGAPQSKPGNLRFELLLNGQHAAEHTVVVHPPVRSETSTEAERRNGN